MLFGLICGFLPYPVLEEANALVRSGAGVKLAHPLREEVRPSPVAAVVRMEEGRFYGPAGDTLIVGDVPAETLVINGTWSHSGPIFVINDGVLLISGASVTLDGNLFLMGNGKVVIDSSYLYFPQTFNYQYGVILAENSEYVIRNSRTSFNGFTFGIAVVDSARFVEENVINRDFTTFGAFGERPHIEATYTDNVGEVVVGRRGRYVFRHSDTLLIWHRFPPGCTANVVFPSSDTVLHYVFDSTLTGVSGVDYSVLIDTTTGVMWGMMVEDSSSVTVSSSYVRSVGLFFRGSDSLSVSGIVNASYYSSYTVPVPDRYLHFNDSYVNTFSLYPMDTTRLYVRGSVVGEILALGNAYADVANSLVDGSGGYMGSSENGMNVGVLVSINTNLQASDNSILIFAYSSQTGFIGQTVASGNSILVVAQSSLLDYPTVYDHAFAWVSNIRTPAYLPLESSVLVEGDAYGEAGPLGSILSFSSYSLYYERDGDTLWHPIVEDETEPVKDGVLGVWDTHGLTPGRYFLKLKTVVSTGDSISVLRVVNLGTVSVSEREEGTSSFKLEGRDLHCRSRCAVYDRAGREVFNGKGKVRLHRGVYFVRYGDRTASVVIR